MKITKKIFIENQKKIIFTAGPASLSVENLSKLKPCFGRGDDEYLKVENYVLTKLLKISGQKKIARIQGSGSLGIEIMAANFLFGNVLIIDTGYYSDRLSLISYQVKKNYKNIKKIKTINWKNINEISGNYDWIFACSTETSCGLKLPIESLYDLKKRTKSKLMIDATASMGLEKKHYLADAISFSSCKGLFGLTGACFVAFNVNIENEINSFYLNLSNHLQKKMTGPYHTIYSLFEVLKKYENFRYSVLINKEKFCKKMKNYLTLPKQNQPLLCTHTSKKIIAKNRKVILYEPRNNLEGSIVCHLGEAHLKKEAKGKIIDHLNISK
jgi:aspartate aminotransferase-like enzyme